MVPGSSALSSLGTKASVGRRSRGEAFWVLLGLFSVRFTCCQPLGDWVHVSFLTSCLVGLVTGAWLLIAGGGFSQSHGIDCASSWIGVCALGGFWPPTADNQQL
jgi:hypothetical protein